MLKGHCFLLPEPEQLICSSSSHVYPWRHRGGTARFVQFSQRVHSSKCSKGQQIHPRSPNSLLVFWLLCFVAREFYGFLNEGEWRETLFIHVLQINFKRIFFIDCHILHLNNMMKQYYYYEGLNFLQNVFILYAFFKKLNISNCRA